MLAPNQPSRVARWLAGVAPAVALAVVLVAVRRRFVLVTVQGRSMEPTVRPGDRLLLRRCGLAAVRAGDLVVVRPPMDGVLPGTITAPPAPRPAEPVARPAARRRRAPRATGAPGWEVKRVAALPGQRVPDPVAAAVGVDVVPAGQLVVLGDGPTSIDSRHRGFFTGEGLLGVVVSTLPRRPGSAEVAER